MTGTDAIQALFIGLSLSSILILTALGLAITFGVMRVINMAHGDMLMLGAYAGYLFTDAQALPRATRSLGVLLSNIWNYVARPDPPVHLDWRGDFGLQCNLYLALPLTFLLVGAVGYLLEVGLIRFLYGRPLDTLLATWGVGLVLQQFVRLVFGADMHALHRPEELEGLWEVAGVPLPRFRIFIIGFACLCLVGVYLWFYRTRFGLQIRAVTQNRPIAAALGISTRRVDSLTFAFGTGLAGVAGCIVGHLYTFEPQMGTGYVVDAFMVVILGGMGHLGGTVAAGILMGTGQGIAANLFAKEPAASLLPWLPCAGAVDSVLGFFGTEMMAKVLVLLVVLGFILYRPTGLFFTKERTYE